MAIAVYKSIGKETPLERVGLSPTNNKELMLSIFTIPSMNPGTF
jgi:hypothetical protein